MTYITQPEGAVMAEDTRTLIERMALLMDAAAVLRAESEPTAARTCEVLVREIGDRLAYASG